MNPNGMRAWRRFARSVRRKQNRASRASRALWIADGTGRWYRRQQGFFKQRPSVPARVFSPRSLVGMTMGARKRAARIACVKHPFKLRRLKLLWFKCFCRDAAGRQETEQDRKSLALYADQRSKYRIGQRLRPCPGCCACFYRCDPDFTDGVCADCGQAHATCDGFGVLAAGSEK